MYKIKNANKQSNGKLLLSFHHKRHISSMCEQNNIKCILNVTIEITSSKVINLTKSIKICFDLNHLNSSILLQRFAFKGIISEYGEDLHVYREKPFYHLYLQFFLFWNCSHDVIFQLSVLGHLTSEM